MSVEQFEAEFAHAKDFYTKAKEQLDVIAYEEDPAKVLLLAGLATRSAVLFAGDPGGAKSLLSKNVFKIFEGGDEEGAMAIVPADSQLQPIKLVGGKVETIQIIGGEEQKIVNEVVGIIQPNVRGLWLDEATRVNPFALNATLGILEEKIMKTADGEEVPLDNLTFMATTMNPSESHQSTFTVSDAYVSRHIGGAIMGADLNDENAVKLFSRQTPDIDQVKPVVTFEDLVALQNTVKTIPTLPDTAMRGVKLARAVKQELRDHNIGEANRIYLQFGKLAATLGLFEGRLADGRDVDQALSYVLGAHVGAQSRLTKGADPVKTLASLTENVYSRAKLAKLPAEKA